MPSGRDAILYAASFAVLALIGWTTGQLYGFW
jgi:hypothetical protein